MPGKTLVALGGAECAWRDLEAAEQLLGDTPYDMGAVNEAARDYPGRLSLFCSLHPEKVGNWQRIRKNAGRNDDYLTVSHKGHADARIDHVFREIWAGSSGLYICTTAIFLLGYERVIVCGIPMDERHHYHTAKPWKHARNYQRWWREAATSQKTIGRIKSMSGYTKELLGMPTKEWIYS